MAQDDSSYEPGRGNIVQAAIATVPLFLVFLYFLVEAALRPRKSIYALDADDDVAVEQAWAETPPLLPLYDMVMICLTFQFLFMLLFCFVSIFIPRRRQLMRSYLEKGETCLGDVTVPERSDGPCASDPKYGEVVYTYPGDSRSDWTIRKSVRVYQKYSRERTTIVRLLGYPFSGQPKTDVEMDVRASQAAKGQVQQMAVLAFAWVTFTFLCPIFILIQMSKLRHDAYEDVSKATKIYLYVGVVGINVVSVGGVYIRWWIYRHWLISRGLLLQEEGSDGEVGAAGTRSW